MRLLAGDKVKSMFDTEVLIPEATRSVRRSLKRGRQVQEVHDFGACLNVDAATTCGQPTKRWPLLRGRLIR